MPENIDPARIERLVRDAEALPPCPAVLARVGELSKDPRSSARDLGRVIGTDEALTARLIKLVNSPFYGLRGTVSTVTQAVVILGYQEIKNVVYSVQAEDVFRRNASAGAGIDVVALWDHSLQVAVLAREMSYRVRHPVPEEVFVSGIIHDLGQVILNELLGEEYRKFRARAHADDRDLAAAERGAFGTDHAEIGCRLTAKWNFPELLQVAVRNHHGLPQGDEALRGPGPMILAANTVTLARERGRTAEEALSAIPERVRGLLRLDLMRLDESLGKAAEEYSRLRGSFELAADESAEGENVEGRRNP